MTSGVMKKYCIYWAHLLQLFRSPLYEGGHVPLLTCCVYIKYHKFLNSLLVLFIRIIVMVNIAIINQIHHSSTKIIEINVWETRLISFSILCFPWESISISCVFVYTGEKLLMIFLLGTKPILVITTDHFYGLWFVVLSKDHDSAFQH